MNGPSFNALDVPRSPVPAEPIRWGLGLWLFLCSYAPLPLVLLPRYVGDLRHVSGNGALTWFGIAFGLSLVSAATMRLVLRRLRGVRLVTVASAQAKPGDLLAYAIPYLASFVGVDFREVGQVGAFLVLLLLLGALAVRTGTVFLNPWLALVGYELYEVEYEGDGRRWKTFWLSREWVRPGMTYRVTRLGAPVEIVTK